MAFTAYQVPEQLRMPAPRQRVYVRQRWNAEWQAIAHLWCQSVRTAIAPNSAQIVLEWRYGAGKQPTDGVFNAYLPLELLGWFVKVEVDHTNADGSTRTDKYWGVIWEEDRQLRGTANQRGVDVASGRQYLIAFGIDILYRRAVIDRSAIEKLAGDGAEIRRALVFNGPDPLGQPRANRSIDVGPNGAYRFTETLSSAQYWSTNNIVNYLHRLCAPLGTNDWDRMQWSLAAGRLHLLPSEDRPVIECHGRTLGDVFDQLMNRTRGLGWYVIVDEAENRPYIVPISLSSEPVVMADGWTLEPAVDQVALYNDLAPQQVPPIIRRDRSAQFDQVRVVGSRIRSCFTVSAADGTLEPDWTAAQRSSYNSAAAGLPGYPDDTHEREAANARARSRPDLERVFACFRLVDNFARVRDGLGGAATDWLPNARGDAAEPVYRPELRLVNYLPLEDHADTTPGKQFLRPLVLLRVFADEADAANDRYLPVDRLGQLAGVEGTGEGVGLHWSAHVRMSEHDAGFWLTVAGAPQHVLAGDEANDFVPLAGGEDDRQFAQYDWRTDLVATVAMEADRQVIEAHPADHLLPDTDNVRRLVLAMPEARLDYLPVGTVVGLSDDGQLEHQASAIYLRDDRGRMRSLAEQAYVWYRRVRQAVSVTLRGHFPYLAAGQFLVELGRSGAAESIEAVISRVEHDFESGTTTISTDYAELDLRRVL